MLETVLLGGLHGDVLRIWRADGEPEFRQVQSTDALVAVLGRGLLARTSSEPNRFREVGLLDATSGVLLLSGRGHLRAGEAGVTTNVAVIQTHLGPVPQSDQSAWAAWGRWLGHVVFEAAGRGEFVVVETGTWDAVPEPYVLMGVFLGPAGEWISHVEAEPTPTCVPWNTTGDGKPGTPVDAPARLDTVDVAGLLALQAVQLWARSPLDVVLTFGTNPAGAWSPDAPGRPTATGGNVS
jgi:hypothetical protein